MSAELFGPAATATGTSLSSFSSMVPNYTTVRRTDPQDTGAVSDIHAAMCSSVVVSLVVGFVIGILVRSKVPFLTALATSVILVVLYEHALRNHPGSAATPAKENN